VLSADEAATHAHLAERGVYANVDGLLQPAPAPRFEGTPSTLRPRDDGPRPSAETLEAWGLSAADVEDVHRR
jgi:alpha-methylacyl-CoA racemase